VEVTLLPISNFRDLRTPPFVTNTGVLPRRLGVSAEISTVVGTKKVVTIFI
jgi:hypothetical protein